MPLASGVGSARTVAAGVCSANRVATAAHYAALSTLAYAVGRPRNLSPAGAELRDERGDVYDAKLKAQHDGILLGGTCGALSARASRRCGRACLGVGWGSLARPESLDRARLSCDWCAPP